MANTSINLVGLDFDTIKDSLKTYLKSQPILKDYDFEGSNINVLLDILSYNTFQNAFYLNMVASESFLDSAQLKDSVISHAKELNYVPRSVRSASANINISFTSNNSTVYIPKYTSFTTNIGSDLFTFLTDDDYLFFSNNAGPTKTYNLQNIKIYEGQLITDSFVVKYDDPTQRFVITDPNIDTRSLSVSVIEDGGSTTYQYTQASSLLDLKSTSQVYFLQGAEKNRFEIIFGDDIIGRRPKDTSIVEVKYRTSRASAGNGASLFYVDTAFTNFSTAPYVTTNEIASGGTSAESIESIKYYAPRHFQIQERAINVSDYEIILKQRFPEIENISAYGGEELKPPKYGKVYISVNIEGVEGLPQSKIQEYTNFLKPRSPLTIDPIFISPEFLYYSVKSSVKYNVNVTNLKSEQLKSMVLNKILEYNDTYLNDFKSTFRYSKFVSTIDTACNLSIVSNDTDIEIYKKITPALRTTQNIKINFDIPLTKNVAKLANQYSIDDLVTIRSSEFILNGERVRIHDDGEGILRVVKPLVDKFIVVIPNIGNINYEDGTLNLINFRLDAYLGNFFKLYARTREKDFSSNKNVILTLEPSEIDVRIIPVRDLVGSSIQSCQRV